MGSGIAQVSAAAGYETIVREVEQGFLDRGMAGIGKSLDRAVQKEKLGAAERDATMARLHPTLELADLAACDLVIEAITENLGAKHALFGELGGLCAAETIFASNTSSLSITELAAETDRPERRASSGSTSSAPCRQHRLRGEPAARSLHARRDAPTGRGRVRIDGHTRPRRRRSISRLRVRRVRSGKSRAIACGDNTGFVVNRLLVPYMLDAIRAYEAGVASIPDIDKGLRLGCGYPMGPFTLGDFVGLDTLYHITGIPQRRRNFDYDEYKEARFASPPLLRRMYLAGYHGRKTGKGFYDYRPPSRSAGIQQTVHRSGCLSPRYRSPFR